MNQFRVWQKEHKRFLYPVENSPHVIDSKTGEKAYLHTPAGTAPISIGLTLNGLVYYRCDQVMGKMEDVVLQQYIGLKDRDGKEIYEGDILYSFHGEAVHTEVIYNKGDEETDNFGILDDRWCYKYPNGNINFLNAYRAKRLKIVGNIFENRELLCEK